MAANNPLLFYTDWNSRADYVGDQPASQLQLAMPNNVQQFFFNNHDGSTIRSQGHIGSSVAGSDSLQRLRTARSSIATRCTHFTGRHHELRCIKNILENHSESGETVYCVIWGITGVGKTELALQYWKDVITQQPCIDMIWLTASDQKVLQNWISKACHELKLPCSINQAEKIFKDWLERHDTSSQHCLIVLDDVRQETWKKVWELVALQPPRCRFLITTRTKRTIHKLALDKFEDCVLEISPLDVENAGDMLFEIGDFEATQSERDKAVKLIKVLGGLPLAIKCAAITLEEYGIAYAWESKSPVLDWKIEKKQDVDQDSVATPATSLPQALKERFDCFWQWQLTNEPNSLQDAIFGAMSFLHPDKISESLLKDAELFEPEESWQPLRKIVKLVGRFRSNAEDLPVTPKKVIHRLEVLSLVVRRSKDSLWIHNLIQSLSRMEMNTSCKKTHIRKAVFILQWALAQHSPNERREDNKSPTSLEVLCHIHSILDKIADIDKSDVSFTLEKLHLIDMKEEIAILIFCAGKSEEAAKIIDGVSHARKDLLRDCNPNMLKDLEVLALRSHDRGKYDSAADIIEYVRRCKHEHIRGKGVNGAIEYYKTLDYYAYLLQCQGSYEKAFKHNDVAYKELFTRYRSRLKKHALISMSNLALLQRYRGEYNHADMLNAQVLEDMEGKLGLRHLNTLTCMDNFAVLQRCQGYYSDAEKLHEKALRLKRELLGHSHCDTLVSMENLALLRRYQGRYDLAEELSIQVLEGWKMKLGLCHPDTLTSIDNLAVLRWCQGQYHQAYTGFNEALRGRKLMLGLEHPDYLTSIHNLAVLRRCQAQYHEADAGFNEALRGRKLMLGPEHPDTLTTMDNLAVLYRYQERYDIAESKHKDILGRRKKVLGSAHPDYFTSVDNLAVVLRCQGQYGKARLLHEKARDGRIRALGSNHPDTLTSVDNLAVVCHLQGQYDKARLLHEKALDGRTDVLGVHHPDTFISADNLAVLLSGEARFELVRAFCSEVLELVDRSVPEHPDTLSCLHSIGCFYSKHGHYQDAVGILQQAIERRESALGPEHPDTLSSHNQLATVQRRLSGLE